MTQPEGKRPRWPHRQKTPSEDWSRQQKRMQELQQTVERQKQRLDELAQQFERLLNDHDEAGSALQEIQGILKARNLEQARSPYEQQVKQIHDLVRRYLPRNAIVLMASKGDPELTALTGRIGWHFPRNPDGQYAGYYPAKCRAAIAHLEAWRAEGAQYLLFPATAYWWFDHYPAFKQYLDRRYRVLLDNPECCRIYSLEDGADQHSSNAVAQMEQVIAEFQTRYDRDPAILDCSGVMNLAAWFPQLATFIPPAGSRELPYMDHSVDIVVTSGRDGISSRESRRVAAAACVTVASRDGGFDSALDVEWLPGQFETEWPMVSLVLPCSPSQPASQRRLKSLYETLPNGFRGEIVLIETPSSQPAQGPLPPGKHLSFKVVRAGVNSSFADCCNSAALQASHEMLVFLHPEWIGLPGWLAPLLRIFHDFPKAGAVSGKLMAPDGTLFEAGAFVSRSGATVSIGRGDDNLDAPLYNYVREVDCCSNAVWATRRSLWQQLGGLEPDYFQGGCEVLDYCFRAREQGYRIYYQPESLAVACPSGFPGFRSSHPNKISQAISQLKFAHRWRETLRSYPHLPEGREGLSLPAMAFQSPIRLQEVKSE